MVRKLKGAKILSFYSFPLFFFRFVRQLYFVVVSDSGTNADGKRREENRRRRRCRLEFHSLQTSDFSSYTTPSFLSSFLLLLRFLRLIVSFHFYYGLMVVVVVSFCKFSHIYFSYLIKHLI